MRDVDHGQRQVLLQGADLLTHPPTQLGVQIRQRLVEQQHLRLQHDGAGDGDALLLAAGQFARQAMLVAGQAHQRELRRCLLPRSPPPRAAGAQAVADILQHRHVGEQRVGLEHHRHVSLGRRQRGDIGATDHDAPGAGLLQAGDQPQRAGLAAAGRAQQRHQAGARDGEADLVHRDDRAVTLADRVELDRRRAHPCTATTVVAGRASVRRPSRRSPTSAWITSSTSSMNTISTAEYTIATPRSPTSTRPTI